MTAKLTEAQRRCLTRMALGDEVWTINGRSAHAFWYTRIGDRAPTRSTLEALRVRNLVAVYTRDSTGAKYHITAAGRAALEQQEPPR